MKFPGEAAERVARVLLTHGTATTVELARELNLDQIKDIANETDVELEFFVSGALCVSFSGNCYMSIAGGERSANRGSCAQNCRLPYNLTDGTGKTLIANSHLLSIKDLDLSDQLPNLIEAGITSFKIEILSHKLLIYYFLIRFYKMLLYFQKNQLINHS